MYIYVHVCTCMYMYVCMYVCLYVCMYVCMCMYICMYIYIYIYIYIYVAVLALEGLLVRQELVHAPHLPRARMACTLHMRNLITRLARDQACSHYL